MSRFGKRLAVLIVAVAACGGEASPSTTRATTTTTTTSTVVSTTTVPPTTTIGPTSLEEARGEIDACTATMATDFVVAPGDGSTDAKTAVRSALAGPPVEWGALYAEGAGVGPVSDASETILRVQAPGAHFDLTVAVVEVAERGDGDWAALAAYHCAEPDLPYPRPAAPRLRPDPVPLLPADNALQVTVDAVIMADEALALLDGMVLNGIGEVTLDGDPAGSPFILRVEDGAASILRGRWCGTWVGPLPFDDGEGGAIVFTDRPELVRCRPGSGVFSYGEATPLAIGAIDGRRVIAALSWDEEGGVVAIDVEDGTRSGFFDFDADSVTSAAYGGGRWLVGVGEEGDDEAYVVLTEGGAIDETAVAPPRSGAGTRTALSDDGRHALLARVEGDEFVLTRWNVESGVEEGVIRVAGAHQFVYIDSVDLAPPRAIINLGAINGERHPFVILVVDLDTGEVALVDPGGALSFAPLQVSRVVDTGLPWLELDQASFLES